MEWNIFSINIVRQLRLNSSEWSNWTICIRNCNIFKWNYPRRYGVFITLFRCSWLWHDINNNCTDDSLVFWTPCHIVKITNAPVLRNMCITSSGRGPSAIFYARRHGRAAGSMPRPCTSYVCKILVQLTQALVRDTHASFTRCFARKTAVALSKRTTRVTKTV